MFKEPLQDPPSNAFFSSLNIILISGSMMSSKFQEAFRDENAAKKGEVDGENDVKSGKKLQ